MYDYSKLKGRITEIFGTQEKFASAMGMSNRTMSARMKQKSWWKQSEIEKAIELLKLSIKDIQVYFFAKIVQ